MDEDRAATVREWSSRTVDGHAGLRRLASEEFSGVIETDRGSVQAFMTNGAVVGIDGAGIEDLDGMAMTAYTAPDDAIPLLFAMQDQGGEPRAQYYTEETPLTEVNRTLEEGGFTGYIELSENVLSGDYYVVYHAGRSSSVAFVGNSSRLLTGDEAFERAADEVGIYDVVDVDVTVIEVPGGEGTADADGGGTSAAAGGGVAGTDSGPESPPGERRAGDETADATEGGTADGTGSAGDAAEPAADATNSGTADAPDGTGDAGGTTASPGGSDSGIDTGGTGTASSSESTDPGSDATSGGNLGPGPGPSSTGTTPYAGEEIRVGAGLGGDEGDAGGETGAGGDEGPGTTGGTDERGSAPSGPTDDVSAEEGTAGSSVEPTGEGATDAAEGSSADQPSADRGTADQPPADRSTPDQPPRADRQGTDASADAPDSGPADPDPESAGRQADGAADAEPERGEEASDGSDSATPDTGAGTAGPSADHGEAAGGDTGTETGSRPKRDRLAAELRETRGELDRVRAERDDHRAEAERLRERVETLEERIEALEEGGAVTAADAESEVTADTAERSLSPTEALAETSLFVRYESKADPTLEAARDGGADAETVNRNLRLEHHTQFEVAGTVVDGEPFQSFLTSSFEYQFVEWVIRGLLYELRSTGSEEAMEGLYDAIPAVDRIHFRGEVEVDAADGPGEESSGAREFDVIFRDRMGGPLLVANLHESRDPTETGAVTTLINDARTVAVTAETIGAAFAVTTSYYEPQALKAASDAAGGGFLSRSRKESYVKMDRKRGFHLCLVEARDGDFNLKIPDL